MAAPTQRKPASVDEAELYLINYWAAYRNPNAPKMALAEAKTTYRTNAYTPPNFPPLTIPPRLDLLIEKKLHTFRDRKPKTAEELAFLAANQRGLWTSEVAATNWRGTKFLGEGANAKVGLWEYSGDRDKAPLRKQIVIKQSIDSDMVNEANIMDTCRPNVHLLAQVKKAEIVRDPKAEGLPPDSAGQVRRLYLEYCPNGDLWELLNRRIFTYGPFQENTVWLIFKCLADCLGMLHHGIEFTFNANREAQVIVKKNNRPIVHFDLKLENVFLGSRDENHTITPVFKVCDRSLKRMLKADIILVGDFGQAEFVVPIQKLGKDYFEYDAASYDMNGTTRTWRGTKGTASYHPPEQFTERWDFSDYQCLGPGMDPRDRVAGNFSDKTNTWQVGAVMWRLIVLSAYNGPDPAVPLYADSRDGPDWTRPFIPNFNLNGSPPKCCTYGPELRAFSNKHNPPGPYSNTLIDMVFECLYELPRWRPTAQQLRTRIARMFKPDQTEIDMFAPEPWESLMPAGPPTGGIPGAPVQNTIASPALPDMGTVVGTLAPALGSAFGIEGLRNEEDEDDDSGFVDAGKGKKRKRRGP